MRARILLALAAIALALATDQPAQAGILCAGQAVTIAGTPGADVINGTSGVDVISGLDGDDVIFGMSGSDVICGGAGNDVLSGGSGNDTLEGSEGSDTAQFSAAVVANLLIGIGIGEGADTLASIENVTGSPFADVLVGNHERNVLLGLAGPDFLDAHGGDDVLIGGQGADDMPAGPGNDVIDGGGGNDVLNGSSGNDFLDGGPATDVLDGNADGDVCFNGETKANCETSILGDSDTDGCADAQEQSANPALGGLRNPASFWDFYDVPAGLSDRRDRRVTSQDIFALLGRFSSTDGGPGTFDRNSDPRTFPNPLVPGALRENYHPAFDRGALVGSDAWDLGPPNGSITGSDVMGAIAQFAHTCV